MVAHRPQRSIDYKLSKLDIENLQRIDALAEILGRIPGDLGVILAKTKPPIEPPGKIKTNAADKHQRRLRSKLYS